MIKYTDEDGLIIDDSTSYIKPKKYEFKLNFEGVPFPESNSSYFNLSFNGLIDHLNRNQIYHEIKEQTPELKSVYYKTDDSDHCSKFVNTGVQIFYSATRGEAIYD
tara:strand:+ start:61 stop:378 length:318 start_codon:yes stop_codon:yes gene_type:complete